MVRLLIDRQRELDKNLNEEGSQVYKLKVQSDSDEGDQDAFVSLRFHNKFTQTWEIEV